MSLWLSNDLLEEVKLRSPDLELFGFKKEAFIAVLSSVKSSDAWSNMYRVLSFNQGGLIP